MNDVGGDAGSPGNTARNAGVQGTSGTSSQNTRLQGTGSRETAGVPLSTQFPEPVARIVRWVLDPVVGEAAEGLFLAGLQEFGSNDALLKVLQEVLSNDAGGAARKLVTALVKLVVSGKAQENSRASGLEVPHEVVTEPASLPLKGRGGSVEGTDGSVEGTGDPAPARAMKAGDLPPAPDRLSPLAACVRVLTAVALVPRCDAATEAAEALGRIQTLEAVSAASDLAVSSAGREVRKAAKRALYRLRSAGLAASPAPRDRAYEPVLRPMDKLTSAFVTAPDGQGVRTLWFIRPQGVTGGRRQVILLVLEDARGITTCWDPCMGKKELEEMRSRFSPAEATPVPLDYARSLVARARARNVKTGSPVPAEFHRWVAELLPSPSPLETRSPAWELVPEEEVKESFWPLIEGSGGLVDEPEFVAWVIRPEHMKKYVDHLGRFLENRVATSKHVAEERFSRIVEGVIEEFWPVSLKEEIAGRLEEIGYIFSLTERRKQAEMALAVAVYLGEPEARPKYVKLFDRLAAISLELARGGEGDDRGEVQEAEEQAEEELKGAVSDRGRWERSRGGLYVPR